ncbi:aminotransferase class V-fold PLP-dependent enzyme [Lysobacter niastensis]|uniref:Aminotransferase class V-fold PLP-dependent enzyme n=1 Tax=Lysobacter niastensis TaxID=380629 RepID=A0ABS0BAA0_9GAMM|nr:aminotransferase class V-fold PLP-dependent enzyme [Lysobacter niastensis]MBF6024621.1 aminotransferase class V-fold PLP-dependent enzyme [Lysobacter niastensis]
MSLTRREFLAVPAALAAGSMLPAGLFAAVVSETPAMPDLSDWGKVRAQFVLDPAYSHFASFFISSHPAPVRDAIEAYRRAIDRNPFLTVEQAMFEDVEHNLPIKVATEIADYLGGRAQDVCLTRSTTESLALVYHGLPLKPGDEVLCTTHDHYSHHESIRLATARAGATMRKVPLFEDAAQATTESIIARLRQAIGPKTKAIGLTWVHSSSGIRLPVREITAALRASGEPPLIILDGVHGLGSVDETVATMGVDFFCAGTHKWMLGPRGTALVWANAQRWAQLRPTIPNFTDMESYEAWMADREPATPNNAARMAPGGFHAFEHQWGAAAAFRMHRQMGKAKVAARIRSLNDQLKEGLAKNPKVRMHTPRSGDLSAGLVAFEVDGLKPNEVVQQLLARNIIASTSPYAITYARLAPSLVNTPEEVDKAVKAVREISG